MSLTLAQEKVASEIILAQKANKHTEVKRLAKKLAELQPTVVRITVTMKPVTYELPEHKIHPDEKPEVFGADSTLNSMHEYGSFHDVLQDWSLLDDAEYKITIEDEDGNVAIYEP